MSLFVELKRRNVFKVGIAYVVAAWLVAQVTELAGDAFGAPEWVMKMLLIVLALGLPVALILAWAFELTPEGVKREKDVDRSHSITPQTGKKLNNTILVLMALAIGYLLFDKFSAQPGSEPIAQEALEQPAVTGAKSASPPPVEGASSAVQVKPISPQSIAVLPFDNRSKLDEDEFFVEGVHDDLLTNLAKIASLKVISRTSVARYKNTKIPIPQIAGELGVATVMEGAVQRAGGTVRINVQLIDAQTDEHLWAETYDRELSTENLFAIQTEISKEIALALEATLSPEEQQRVDARPTENLAAYSAYLRGRQMLSRRTAETSDQALIEFQRAVELDPQFALAWTGIAEAAQSALWLSDMNLPETLSLMQEAVEKAMAINDRLGEVQLARAKLIRMSRGDDKQIEAAYRLATELSPGYAPAWESYAGFVSQFPRRRDEALQLAERAAELDPLSADIQTQIIDILRSQGKYAQAQQQLSQLIEQDPKFAMSYELMADLKGDLGHFDESIEWYHKAQSLDPGNIGYAMREMWPQMAIGNTAELDKLLTRMEVMDPDSSTLSFMEFWINIYRGNLDAAMEAARQFEQKTGYRPGSKFGQMLVSMQRGDEVASRELVADVIPAYLDSKTFQEGLEQRPSLGCGVAWTLIHTGDVEMGVQLARQTIDYFQNNLPGNSEEFSTALCYMVLEQPEQALQAIEHAVKSGGISGWWFDLRHPAYELLRHEPRFIAAENDIQSKIARQRENLKQPNRVGE